MSLEGLWDFLQSLSLSSKNKRWLAEKLQESAHREEMAKATIRREDEQFYQLAGIWSDDPEADKMEEAIKNGRLAGTTRQIASFDD